MLKKIFANCIIVATIVAFHVSCQGDEKAKNENNMKSKEGETEMIKLEITSPAFGEGDTIPVKYTCDGDDVSVPLSWSAAPEGTGSFVLICDDPDAPMGTWVHWVVINIPPNITSLDEGIKFSADSSLTGVIECMNDFGKVKYGGPCPPKGPVHRYFLKLYALDIKLESKASATKADVEKAMEGHIQAQGELMGKYGR